MARFRAASNRAEARSSANRDSVTVYLLNPDCSGEGGAAPTNLVRDLPEGADEWARGRLRVAKSTSREAEGESSWPRVDLSFDRIGYDSIRILLEGPEFLGQELLDWHESGMDQPLPVEAIGVPADKPIPRHLRPTDDHAGWDLSDTYSWEKTPDAPFQKR